MNRRGRLPKWVGIAAPQAVRSSAMSSNDIRADLDDGLQAVGNESGKRVTLLTCFCHVLYDLVAKRQPFVC